MEDGKLDVTDLGLGEYTIQVVPKNTLEENTKEAERMMNEFRSEAQQMDTASDDGLNHSNLIIDDHETKSSSIELLNTERQMQNERLEEWNKEKKAKKRKRVIKMVFWIAIVAILGLALLGGYRIPVPEEWIVWADGAWNAARDFVVKLISR